MPAAEYLRLTMGVSACGMSVQLYTTGTVNCRDTVFFDLQKAFHSVQHKLLLQKLSNLGVEPHTLAWISSYLYNRSQKVGVAGTTSSPCHVLSGVPEGLVLGPLLFLVYIDGLTGLQLKGGSLTMFADDLLLHKVVH